MAKRKLTKRRLAAKPVRRRPVKRRSLLLRAPVRRLTKKAAKKPRTLVKKPVRKLRKPLTFRAPAVGRKRIVRRAAVRSPVARRRVRSVPFRSATLGFAAKKFKRLHKVAEEDEEEEEAIGDQGEETETDEENEQDSGEETESDDEGGEEMEPVQSLPVSGPVYDLVSAVASAKTRDGNGRFVKQSRKITAASLHVNKVMDKFRKKMKIGEHRQRKFDINAFKQKIAARRLSTE